MENKGKSGKRIHRGPAELLNAGAWLAIPNEYVDDLLPTMKPSEFAVLLVIKRWTHGFGKASRTMSQGMIQEKTGLSRSGVRKALKALEGASHIVKVRESDHWRPCEWALNEDYLAGSDDAECVTEKPSVGHSVTLSGPQSNPASVKDTMKDKGENTNVAASPRTQPTDSSETEERSEIPTPQTPEWYAMLQEQEAAKKARRRTRPRQRRFATVAAEAAR